jgi:hypothetical protein
MDAGQPQWFPLKGAKSGQILLNTEFLAPGDIPSSETSGSKPIKGNIFFNYFSRIIGYIYFKIGPRIGMPNSIN